MAGRGPAPKPAHLRQRTNKKVGATMIQASGDMEVPPLVHPTGEAWHTETLKAWQEFFESPMASQWLPTDITGLAMLAVCYDGFYKTGDIKYMQEIRLQRPHYGLTPLDRSRLQWEVTRGEEAEARRKPVEAPRKTGTSDPRAVLMAVK